MKIDTSVKSTNGLSVTESQQGSGRVARKSTGSTSSDSVQISALSTQLQDIAASSANGAFDIDKVQEIKLAIAHGRFEVNTEKVADGLLKSVRDLLKTSGN